MDSLTITLAQGPHLGADAAHASLAATFAEDPETPWNITEITRTMTLLVNAMLPPGLTWHPETAEVRGPVALVGADVPTMLRRAWEAMLEDFLTFVLGETTDRYILTGETAR